MLKIEHTEVVGWGHAIRGMRNPLNSWAKSDSDWLEHVIGPNDLNLMKKLRKAGSDHGKFMRMITVYCDITAPLYWWKEYDTYKVGTVANSCSTMHKIAEKEFTLDDFSHEHLIDAGDGLVWSDLISEDGSLYNSYEWLKLTCELLNGYRNLYLETKDKKYWWQMIQLLPSSYNQKRTVMLNYEVLANMYHARKNHKLDEWVAFCAWIEEMPGSALITGEDPIQNICDDLADGKISRNQAREKLGLPRI